MRGLRPVAVTRPLMVLVAMTLAMHVISRTTGSGWLVVVVSGLIAILGLSAVLPALSLTGVQVQVQAPTDGTAGTSAPITVTAAGRVGPGKLRLVTPASDWVRLDGPATGSVSARPDGRGVVPRVVVEVRSAAPFGLVWWRRRLDVALARPFEVGPCPVVARSTPAPRPEEGARPGVPAHLSPETVRGLREYVPGDQRRLVSWVATARHGRLMVKELEDPRATARLTLVVDLRGDESAAEEAASRAAGMALKALGEGAEVVLATAEPTGPRLGPVESALQVSRRLARATGDGPPATPDAAGWVEVVRTAAR